MRKNNDLEDYILKSLAFGITPCIDGVIADCNGNGDIIVAGFDKDEFINSCKDGIFEFPDVFTKYAPKGLEGSKFVRLLISHNIQKIDFNQIIECNEGIDYVHRHQVEEVYAPNWNNLYSFEGFHEVKRLYLNSKSLSDCVALAPICNHSRLEFIESKYLKGIDGGSLYRCNYLKEIRFDSLEICGHSHIFDLHINLERVYLPSLKDLDCNNFIDLKYLEYVDLDSLEVATKSLFSGCIRLKKVCLTNLQKLSGFAFRRCISLENLYLPNVIEATNTDFEFCEKLKTLILPKLKVLKVNMIRYCPMLERIYIGRETELVGEFPEHIEIIVWEDV